METLEEWLDQLMPCERFAESPKVFSSGLIGLCDPKKAFEAQTVGRLELELLVAELVEVLNDDGVEHHQPGERTPSAQPLWLDLGNTLENRFQRRPVNHLIETRQRITHLIQLFKSYGLVKEAALIWLNPLRHCVCNLRRSTFDLQQNLTSTLYSILGYNTWVFRGAQYLEGLEGQIIACRLPAYAPDFNPWSISGHTGSSMSCPTSATRDLWSLSGWASHGSAPHPAHRRVLETS